MFMFFVIVLGFFIASIFLNNFVHGVVLGGLLMLVWRLYAKLDVVARRLKDIEAKLTLEEDAQYDVSTTGNHREDVSTVSQDSDADLVERDDHESTVEESTVFEKITEVKKPFDAELPPSSIPLNHDEGHSVSASAGVEDGAEVDAEVAAISSTYPDETPKPVPPGTPNIIEKLIVAVWSWVTDGNVFVRVGIIVLFMGMTFLTRYAIGQNFVPIEVRLIAICAVATGLLFWGWRQRKVKQNFSLVVQGGGIGLLYLTIFAGFSLYDVIPSGIAFVLLALIVILAATLAVSQDARPLALFATIGGFFAPILTSSGNNNYIGLFSYYSLLNLGIFALAWFKSWRILNFAGFIFTFLVSTTWGVLSYEPQFFKSTEPFLILFFLLYVAIGILFAHKRTPFYKNYVDSSLVFGTPVFAFGLQCAMVKSYEYGVAISAVCLGMFYLVLASVLWKKYGSRLHLLTETFLSLGVIFSTLAIPFAVDGSLSGAAWAIEGAGILWVSIKQQQKYRRYFGVALIFAASIMLLYGLQTMVFSQPFVNSFFIGCVIIAVSATLASYLLSENFEDKIKTEDSLATALLVYALCVLLGGFELEIANHQLIVQHGSLMAVVSGLCIIAYTFLGNKLRWPQAHWVSVGFILPLAVAAALCFSLQSQLAYFYGYLIWPLVLVAGFYGLKQAGETVVPQLLQAAHILAAATIACLLLWDGLWQLMLGYSLLAILFNYLSNKLEWSQLKVLALGYFPVLVLCSILAISIDGNLVSLSSIASSVMPSFPPGYVLWPLGFAVYFYLLYQNREIAEGNNKYLHYGGGLLIGALLWWLGTGSLLLGASVLTVVFCILWQKFDWPEMRVISMAMLPAMLLTAILKFLDGSFHLVALNGVGEYGSIETGYVLWPLSFAVMYWSFWQYDKHQVMTSRLLHGVGVLLLGFVLTWEVSWHLLDYLALFNAWHLAWVPVVTLLVIARIVKEQSWPFSMHAQAYQQVALPVLVFIPVVWSFAQMFSSGHSSPLPWLPVLNPLDIVQIIILMGACLWGAKLIPNKLKHLPLQKFTYSLAGYVFLWLNIDLLRAVHHWVGVPWVFPEIINADISQTLMALFWALGGLLVTTYASRKVERTLWFCGGALLVAVVLKLFLVDLSAQDTIERIVSFTGVGLLLVAVGYFSPLPPKVVAKARSQNHDTDNAEAADV